MSRVNNDGILEVQCIHLNHLKVSIFLNVFFFVFVIIANIINVFVSNDSKKSLFCTIRLFPMLENMLPLGVSSFMRWTSSLPRLKAQTALGATVVCGALRCFEWVTSVVYNALKR